MKDALLCPQCGTTFLVDAAHVKRRHYCSHLCAMQNRSVTKLTPEAVRAIRQAAAAGVPYEQLAQIYQVTPGRISSIVLRRAWRQVL